MYDVIVVGSRCAGSPLAMLLARRGHRVLLVDRATFPSDTLSTHQIQVPGVARLKRWGLLEKVKATNAPAVTAVHFDQGEPIVLDGRYPVIDGVGEVYSVRRTLLDPILIEAAVSAGAEARDGFNVDALLYDAGRVVGIRGRTKDGTSVDERARIVVGADGHRSLVAEQVNAPKYNEKPTLSCVYYAYFSDVAASGLEVYGRPDRAIGVMPTNDGLVCVYTAWPRASFSEYRSNIERNFLATTDLVPQLGERLRAGRRVERFYGTADLPNFFRKPFGPGWALVGDAGYVLDPVTGQGIGDAFRDAEYLAEALHDGLTGRRPLDAALAQYERQRNAAALPMYELTTQIASFAPLDPGQVAVLSALRGNQMQTDRFFGVLTGSIAATEFFSPGNLIRILGPIGFARVAFSMGRKRPTPAAAPGPT